MYFKTDNITIYYEKYGNKNNTILILPGWGNTRKTFTDIINYFKTNYTIYIIDYPNFGNSTYLTKELTIYDYTNLILDFINNLKIKNPIIICHSFGGRITSILTTKIKINKIIMFDVAGIKRRKKLNIYLKEKIYKILKKLIIFIPKNKRYNYYKKLINYFASNDYKSIPHTMRKTFQNIISEDLSKYYQNITNKTLIIWGENDQDTPLKDAYYLNKHIKNSKLIIYNNTSHYSYLKYPQLTNILIENFIKENKG